MRKRKWRKKILVMALGAVLSLQLMVPVLADETSVQIDGSWLTDAKEAESSEMIDFLIEPVNADENTPMPLTTYLYGGLAQITNEGGGKVTAYANTKASTTCDTVKVDIYLQYLDDGSWVYYNNWNYTVKNTSYIARSRTVSVTKGRYYRVKCYHEITKNGIRERCTSATNGIKIN